MNVNFDGLLPLIFVLKMHRDVVITCTKSVVSRFLQELGLIERAAYVKNFLEHKLKIELQVKATWHGI